MVLSMVFHVTLTISLLWLNQFSVHGGPIHHAAAEGDAEKVLSLVQSGEEIDVQDDEFGASPLFIAAAFGRVEVVETIHSFGIPIIDTHEHGGLTPFHLATSGGHLQLVKYLVQAGQDVNKRADDGSTGLWMAASNGHFKVVKELTRHFEANSNVTKWNGESMVYASAYGGNVQILKHFIEELRLDPSTPRSDGTNPVFIACFKGHREAARYLFAMGCDPRMRNEDGLNALDAARASKDQLLMGFISQAIDALDRGLSYSEFVETIEKKRRSAEASEGSIRAELKASTMRSEVHSDGSSKLLAKEETWWIDGVTEPHVLFEHAKALAALRREGEARYELERTIDLFRVTGHYSIEVHEKSKQALHLIHHIDQRDAMDAKELVSYVLDRERISKGTNMSRVTDQFHALVSAREEYQSQKTNLEVLESDDFVDMATEEMLEEIENSERSVHSAKDAAQQAMHDFLWIMETQLGVSLQVYDKIVDAIGTRQEWIDHDSFPVKMPPIYGRSTGDTFDCDCAANSESKRAVQNGKVCAQVVVVETWRFNAHSYGLVGQQFLLGLREIPGLCVFVKNAPYLERKWRPAELGFTQTPQKDQVLQDMPLWTGGKGVKCPDVVIRSFWPLDVTPFSCHGQRCSETMTLVFGATEFKRAPQRWIKQSAEWNETEGVIVLAPSQWAAMGFVKDGMDHELLRIVPHSVDSDTFHPSRVNVGATRAFRKWDHDTFILLHIGSMLDRKGVKELVDAFRELNEWFTRSKKSVCIQRGTGCVTSLKLVLKGSDGVANSGAIIENLERKGGKDVKKLFDQGAIEYIGQQLSSNGIANLLGASDLYVSAYKAEGFNLPVLEAAAVGTPVVVTAGGPTKDFTRATFAKYIPAKQIELKSPEESATGIGRAWMLESTTADITRTLKDALLDSHWREAARDSAVDLIHSKYGMESLISRLVAVIKEEKKHREMAQATQRGFMDF